LGEDEVAFLLAQREYHKRMMKLIEERLRQLSKERQIVIKLD